MTQFNLSFAPFLPWWALALLALLAVAVVALHVLARRPGGWTRALGLALLLAALADPALVHEDREPLKDVVAIVLDHSASQGIGGRTAQTEQARAELVASLTALGNVETRVIDSSASDAANDGTRLFAALNAGLADVPPERIGAAIMVTDGVVHDIPANAGLLGFNAPLHVLVTGREGERDRRIELVEAPRFGIVGKDQTIRARVIDSSGGAEPVAITVRRDGEVVSSLRAVPGEIIRLPVRIDHAGPNVVEIEVAALPDELTTVNNKAIVTLEGVRDKLKVLLISGEPHAGERTWRNLLKSDANVDLVHFTILRPPEKQDGTPVNELALIQFPTADLFGNKVAEFDLIIFDRYANQVQLPSIYFENIVKYVRNGGAMLFAAGPDFAGPDSLMYSPLNKILPARASGGITEETFRPTITAEGRKHPVTRGLKGGDSSPPDWAPWFRQIGGEVKLGTALMSGVGERPLMILSREGKGRVAMLLSDQMWVWARGYQNGGPHLDLLRRLAHWLMKEPDLEEEALRASVRGREVTIERQSVKGEAPAVTVTAPSGASETVALQAAEPGLARGQFIAKELGLHRMNDGVLSVLTSVGPENPREFQEVVSTVEKLRPLAEATGGGVRRISPGAGAGDSVHMPRVAAMRAASSYAGADYIGIKRTQASVVRGVGVLQLALGLLGLALLLGSIVLAWFVEGRTGKAAEAARDRQAPAK